MEKLGQIINNKEDERIESDIWWMSERGEGKSIINNNKQN